MKEINAIEQLRSLRIDRKSFLSKDREENEIYDKDIKAIDLAISALQKTALEVPVQEQCKFAPSTSEGVCMGNENSIVRG